MSNATYFNAGMSLALLVFSSSAMAMGKKPVGTSENPIPNFLQVSPGIYRGGLPEEKGVLHLKKMGVKTIINLQSSRSKMDAEYKAAKKAGIRWISLPISLFNLPNDREVDMILDYMKDPALQPVFIHCKAGRDRTGLFVGLHRVENEGWHPTRAYQEMLTLGYREIYFPLTDIFERRTGMDF